MCAVSGFDGVTETELESDMVRNYRGIVVLWLALCLLGAAGQSYAETIRVGELGLPVGPAWQRAPGDEEQSVGSVILRRTGNDAALEVYIPTHQVQLKTEPEDFFARLDQGWQRRYGDQAVLSWQGPGAAIIDGTNGAASQRYLSLPPTLIGGGTLEIQLNVIAERVLGLPR